MNKDEIIEMARRAGLRQHIPFWSDSEVADALEAFAKLVAAKEREACAKFFDDNDTLMFWGSQAATYIRARGEAV